MQEPAQVGETRLECWIQNDNNAVPYYLSEVLYCSLLQQKNDGQPKLQTHIDTACSFPIPMLAELCRDPSVLCTLVSMWGEKNHRFAMFLGSVTVFTEGKF